jgi:hypothetical protein
MITNYAKCAPEIKSRIATAEAAFNEKALFTCKLNVTLRNKLLKYYIWAWLCMVLKLGECGKLSCSFPFCAFSYSSYVFNFPPKCIYTS